MAVVRDIWHPKGYQMVYKMSGVPHTDVVSVGRVLGLCQLMLLYHNVHRTILEWAARQEQLCYPNCIWHTKGVRHMSLICLDLNSVGRCVF